MALGSLVLLTMGLLTGEAAAFDPAAITGRSIVALAYLTVVGSLFAFTVFAWLLRVAPLPKVATYAYVNPIVAVILGALVLGEPITARTVVAGAVIIVAVALIVSARSRSGRRAPVATPEEALPPAPTGRPVPEVVAKP
jgi:drug/metabolite transporter (DMT)-like permease